MASEKTLNCGPCDYKHETTIAVKWCTECAEALCLTCFEAHKSFKASRNHNVISIKDIDALKGIMLDISEVQRCEQHDKPSEYFCNLHDDVVCIECIKTKHCQCTGWLPISEAADCVKSSVTKETICIDLEDVVRNVEELIDNHETEKINNQNACINLKDEASKLVQSIIQKVKNLEAEFVKTVDLQHKEISSNISSRTLELQGKLQKVKELKGRMSAFEGYASDTHMFLGIRKISTALCNSIEEIKSVTENPFVVMKELQIADSVTSFLSEVSLIGHVKNDRTHIAFKTITLKKIQSHVSVSVSNRIEDMKIQNIVKINVSKSSKLVSALVLSNKQLIFKRADCDIFDIYTTDGIFVRYQSQADNVKYMTVIDSERVAFSRETSRDVSIFNMHTLQTEKKITFNETCYGVSDDSSTHILYTVGRTVIFCVDLLDDRLRISTVELNVDTVFHLSVKEDKLYYADTTSNTVNCFYINGEEIWSFKNELMKSPNGITTDRYGNAYVTCTKSNNLLVISAD
ncbi:uncharacterized protein [Mytilus edulis]|uniref:uncharacterized protein n=1 Tax=Mytilus edulis TaxID=6550 RepID=UPI0039EF3BCB